MNTKHLVLAVAVSLAMAAPVATFAGTLTGGATMPEQIVQEVTAVMSLAKQAQSVENQIQMVYNQALNLEQVPIQLWNSVTAPISALMGVVQNAKGLAYSAQNIGTNFNNLYGNGMPPLGSSYSQSLNSWNANTDDQIKSMLRQFNLQSAQFANVQSGTQTLVNAGQSASGRMAALQAADGIAGVEVGQIQELQQDVMAEAAAQGAYESQRENTSLGATATVDSAFAASAANLGTFPTQLTDGRGPPMPAS
ncbi:MAG: P-type conjugative transfer protein TrbJ [Acidithiobacillus sp.]